MCTKFNFSPFHLMIALFGPSLFLLFCFSAGADFESPAAIMPNSAKREARRRLAGVGPYARTTEEGIFIRLEF